MTNKCLVVPTEVLEKQPFWKRLAKTEEGVKGLLLLREEELLNLFDLIELNKQFRERFGETGVENDPAWQQIGVFALIVQGPKFFVYVRGGKDSSAKDMRLHGKLSIGVGGHVDEGDGHPMVSLYRELGEELYFTLNGEVIPVPRNARIVGIIKDSTNDVGKVHTGLACVLELENPDIAVRINQTDNEIKFGYMVDLEKFSELKKKHPIESWAELVEKNLLPSVLKTN